MMVTSDEADLHGALTAMTMSGGFGTLFGALYRPELEIVPQLNDAKHLLPTIFQVRPTLSGSITFVENCCVDPTTIFTGAGG